MMLASRSDWGRQAISESLRCVVASRDVLGEGPCWVEADQRLYWFDILRAKLLWFEPASGQSGGFVLPMRASAAAPRVGGGLIAATDIGLAHIDTATGSATLIKRFRFPKGFRTNDGKIDPLGRFWWSTMDENGGKRRGHIYVTLPNGRTKRRLGGIAIANTLACSADGATFYLADSVRQTVTAYDIHPKSAALKKPRLFTHTIDSPASPDGSAVDVEGYLWNAQWDAWRIVRYAPDGRIDRIVETPISRPTSCAFGGPDLATLYVTSARDNLPAVELARQPLAGGLFAFEPGVRGLALPTFNG
jgi:sugar lactone lactonase YvrE